MHSVFLFHLVSWFFTRKYLIGYNHNHTFTLLEKIGSNFAFEQELKINEVSNKNTASNLTTTLSIRNNNASISNGMDIRKNSVTETETVLLQKIHRFFEKKKLLTFLENPDYSLIAKIELLETISKSDTNYDPYYKNYGFHLLNGGFWKDWE